MFTNQSETYTESEAYDSASVVLIHTRSELSSDSVSAYDSASVASVASVNQPYRVDRKYIQEKSRYIYLFLGIQQRW